MSKTNVVIGAFFTGALAFCLVAQHLAHREEVKLSFVKGVERGQCSQMSWDINTHALKDFDDEVTRQVYKETCPEYAKDHPLLRATGNAK